MKPLTADSATSSVALERKLQDLCDALHELPETGRRSTDHQAARILLSIDDIVGRVRALVRFFEDGGRRDAWDLVDHAAAQMLLRDLAVIARDLRAVAATVSTDLAAAEAQLRDMNATLNDLTTKVERYAGPATGPAMPAAT